MKKISKKVLRLAIINGLDQALFNIGIALTSKKTKKAISKASQKISIEAANDLRKQDKKEEKIKKDKTKAKKSKPIPLKKTKGKK